MMSKKLLAAVLSILMVFSLTVSAFAAETLSDLEANYTNIAVGATMTVAQNGTGTYAASQTVYDSGTFDFKVVLNTAAVVEAMQKWYAYGEARITDLAGGDEALRTAAMAEYEAQPINGTFTVTITYPTAISVPAAYTANDQSMAGFDALSQGHYKEVSRTATPGEIKIELETKDITAGELYAHPENYLGDLTFTVEGASVSTVGTHTVKGKMTGETSFGLRSVNASISYYTEEVSASVVVKKTSTGGGVSSTTTNFKIIFNINGVTSEVKMIASTGMIDVSTLPAPTKDGYTFDGWYFDAARTQKVTENFKATTGMTLYGFWISNVLDTETHSAYIIGYPSGEVLPTRNITREEVATIFYRLLRDDVRAQYASKENSFSDVAADRWSNEIISTMAKGGFITGYPDGTFAPEQTITRAEFATMATRFAALTAGDVTFSDIAGHWAEEYIKQAATAGWVTGDGDGTFRPNDYITRAEAMTLVNRMLFRSVNAAGLHKDATLWQDMNGSEWYYYIVEEATNSHTYTRQADGLNETWVTVEANPWMNK